MRTSFPVVAAVATLLASSSSSTSWAAGGAPSIEATFPPPDEQRRPDATIERAHAGAARLVVYSPDGRTLASAGKDDAVRVWHARPGDASAGTLAFTLAGNRGQVIALAHLPDPAPPPVPGRPAPRPTGPSGSVVVVTADGTVRRWQLPAATLVETLSLKRTVTVAAVRPAPSPSPLVAVGADQGVLLIDAKTAEVRQTLALPGGVRQLAFGGDGQVLAAVSGAGEARWWNADSGEVLGSRKLGSPGRAVAVLGSTIAVGHASGQVSLGPVMLGSAVGPVTALAGGARAEQLAVAGPRGTEVWDVASGQRLCRLKGHAGPAVALAFSSNGQKLASAGLDRSVRTWTVPLPPVASEDLERIRAALPARATATPARPRKLLVFWRAEAILHKAGVPAGNKAIELLGERTGAFQADFSRDYEVFDPKILRRYDAIVLNSTAHLAIPQERQRQALLDYVQAGGGVIGLHAAIDMFKRWPEGARIVGATFGGHPWGPSGSWAVTLEQPEHPLLRAFGGKDFRMQDEFYELDEPYSRADRRVLMKLDTRDAPTASVTPLHRQDRDFAVAWIKRHGKGRVFYGMFGHRAEPFMNPAVLQFYLDGIQYAVGDLAADDSPVTAQR